MSVVRYQAVTQSRPGEKIDGDGVLEGGLALDGALPGRQEGEVLGLGVEKILFESALALSCYEFCELRGQWEWRGEEVRGGLTFISKWDFIISAVLVTLSSLGKTSTSISLNTSSTGLTWRLSGKLPHPSLTALNNVPVVISSAAQLAFFFMLNILAYIRLDFCHMRHGDVVGSAWKVLIEGWS